MGNKNSGKRGCNFWAHVVKTDHCWFWIGKRTEQGYGRLHIRKNGKQYYPRTHRYSYELHFGRIPYGLQVLHKCDNPPCVNPEHLFLGTMADNMKDMISKGRHSWANWEDNLHF